MEAGKLIVLSGPSGVGKSTAIRAMTERKQDFFFSVSATTRPMRPGERDGVDYYFMDRSQFMEQIRDGQLLEWAEYVGACYGTPAAPLRRALAEGQDALLDIDVQGGMQVKASEPGAVLIFLAPPDMDELERRLRGRGDTPPDVIAQRLEQARWECTQADAYYDYVVVNDEISRAVDEIFDILDAEKHAGACLKTAEAAGGRSENCLLF